MAYHIGGDCVCCGTCIDICPIGAISEEDGGYVIDPEVCADCGACAGACPIGAIDPE